MDKKSGSFLKKNKILIFRPKIAPLDEMDTSWWVHSETQFPNFCIPMT